MRGEITARLGPSRITSRKDRDIFCHVGSSYVPKDILSRFSFSPVSSRPNLFGIRISHTHGTITRIHQSSSLSDRFLSEDLQDPVAFPTSARSTDVRDAWNSRRINPEGGRRVARDSRAERLSRSTRRGRSSEIIRRVYIRGDRNCLSLMGPLGAGGLKTAVVNHASTPRYTHVAHAGIMPRSGTNGPIVSRGSCSCAEESTELERSPNRAPKSSTPGHFSLHHGQRLHRVNPLSTLQSPFRSDSTD